MYTFLLEISLFLKSVSYIHLQRMKCQFIISEHNFWEGILYQDGLTVRKNKLSTPL